MPTKRIDIKLADNKPILTLHGMVLKDRSTTVQRDTRASIHRIFQCLKQIRITRLLTDSNLSSHRGRGQPQWDNDRRQELRHFVQ